MFNKGSIFFILLGISIFFDSCKKEKEVECSCNGEDHLKITNDVGIIYRSSQGDILISGSNGLSFLCDLTKDAIEQKILFTGSTCKKTLDSGIELSYVSISDYEVLTDDLVSIGNNNLTVIHSEDYGDPPGYGYKITGGDINITQTTIPAVAGFTPFARPDDALRIGLLVLSKMNSGGFPSVTVDELRLLGII
jgi:hypothetical protein